MISEKQILIHRLRAAAALLADEEYSFLFICTSGYHLKLVFFSSEPGKVTTEITSYGTFVGTMPTDADLAEGGAAIDAVTGISTGGGFVPLVQMISTAVN